MKFIKNWFFYEYINFFREIIWPRVWKVTIHGIEKPL